ncbi:LacI family DNA-binding transcriptional regulator [Fodinicola feengrottensis]|uniref:LacI family DNA-binding transcriptional regulator n=1 Tax=Fodinicola feengrottensis TaxID=435914 RepID=A0ABP4SGX3_9ACTN
MTNAKPKRPAAVTMRDVAQRLGVSAMTVSRALRGDSGIAEPTRERVLAEVAALGYRRNDLARQLRTGAAHELVGLVVTNLANPFYSQLAVGVEEVATEHGVGVVVASTDADVDRERQLVLDMAGRRIAGLVVVPASNDHSHLAPDQLDGAPVVLAATPPRGIEVDCVFVDDFNGTYEACQQLIARGHTRIGFLGLPLSLWTGSERYRGYAAAMEDAGLHVDEQHVSRHRGNIELAEQATQQMLALPVPPTALITANNRNTVGALRSLRHSPTPVALAGFDDIELADLLQLPLSVVAYDAVDVGRQAARLLFSRIDEPSDHKAGRQQVIIPTRVIDYPRPT